MFSTRCQVVCGPLSTCPELDLTTTGAFQFVCTVGGGLIATKVPNTLVAVTAIAYIPGLAGIIGILRTPLSHQLSLAACAWMLPITGLAIILTWTIVAANIAGHTKRTFANGIEFVFYAAGNIISPFFFIPDEAPRYPTAIKALCGVYAGGITFTTILGLYLWWQNIKRSKIEASSTAVDEAG